jgi:hypothetical protein
LFVALAGAWLYAGYRVLGRGLPAGQCAEDRGEITNDVTDAASALVSRLSGIPGSEGAAEVTESGSLCQGSDFYAYSRVDLGVGVTRESLDEALQREEWELRFRQPLFTCYEKPIESGDTARLRRMGDALFLEVSFDEENQGCR